MSTHDGRTTTRSARCPAGFAAAVLAMISLVACGGSPTARPEADAKPGSTTSTTTAANREARPSPGCSRSAGPAVTLQRTTVKVGDTERWFLLSTPAPTTPTDLGSGPQPDTTDDATPDDATPDDATPDDATPRPRPLVVDFHGLMEGADVHSQMTQFSKLGTAKGFVVAFPNGTGTPLHWDVSTLAGKAGGAPDLEFVTTLLDTLEAQHCIDTSRVYATGLSNGAMMSSLVACSLANRFAAVAPVAGVTMFAGCSPSRAVPMLTVHGTADPILLFNGGVGDLIGLMAGKGSTDPATLPPVDLNGSGYPKTTGDWAVRNGCEPKPVDTKVTAAVMHRVYRCPEGADVEMFVILGGGHSWPGSEFSQSIASIVGTTTFDIDATDEVWSFFTRFTL